jgi:hypothetical protein
VFQVARRLFAASEATTSARATREKSASSFAFPFLSLPYALPPECAHLFNRLCLDSFDFLNQAVSLSRISKSARVILFSPRHCGSEHTDHVFPKLRRACLSQEFFTNELVIRHSFSPLTNVFSLQFLHRNHGSQT